MISVKATIIVKGADTDSYDHANVSSSWVQMQGRDLSIFQLEMLHTPEQDLQKNNPLCY